MSIDDPDRSAESTPSRTRFDCCCCTARCAVYAVAKAAGAAKDVLESLRVCGCSTAGNAVTFVGKGVPDWVVSFSDQEGAGCCKCGCCYLCSPSTGCGAKAPGGIPDRCVCRAKLPVSDDDESETGREQPLLLEAAASAATPAVMTAAAATLTNTPKTSSCPNLLSGHEEAAVMEDLRGKRVYLFLDYDGTLTPIVADPTRAFLPAAMRQLLVGLAPRCARVAIVTGRALRSLRQLTNISENSMQLLFAASHGFHIEAAGGACIRHQVGAQLVPDLREAAIDIGRALHMIDGILLEDNDFAVSVHFRNSRYPWAEAAVEAAIQSVLQRYGSLKTTAGKAVRELRVNVRWDKGRAVAWLLQSMGVDPVNDPDVRVLYLGDDMTDEDAFRFLRMLPRSLGLLVKDAETPLGRHSEAHFSLDGTMGVEKFLRQLHASVTGVKC